MKMKKVCMYFFMVMVMVMAVVSIAEAQVQQEWVRRHNGYDSGANDAVGIFVGGNKVFVGGTVFSYITDNDYALLAINEQTGELEWVKRYNGTDDGIDTMRAMRGLAVTGTSDQKYGTEGYTGHFIVTIKYDWEGNPQWIAKYASPSAASHLNTGTAIAIDYHDNIYIAGVCRGPWNLFEGAEEAKFCTLKYDYQGTLKWVTNIPWPFPQGHPAAIEVDNAGNVYVAGYKKEWGPFPLLDYIVIKYDPDGNLLWYTFYDSPEQEDDKAFAMKINNSGIYVTGCGGRYGTTVKFDADGNLIWADRYNDIPEEKSSGCMTAMELDNAGNIYVTGRSQPAAASDGDFNYVTVKYNSNGIRLWAHEYDGGSHGRDSANALIVDSSSGDVYVTGNSEGPDHLFSYATIKYDTNGTQKWISRYDSTGKSGNIAEALAFSYNKNYVYVAGRSKGEGDASYITTIKYDTITGNQLWESRYNPRECPDILISTDAVMDSGGNVYVSGTSSHSDSFFDFYTAKYDASGNIVWDAWYNNPNNRDDFPKAIALDNAGNLYVAGYTSLGLFENIVYNLVKYDPDGTRLWDAQYEFENTSYDQIERDMFVAIDANNNAYVTGKEIILKYDPNGNTIWSTTISGLTPSFINTDLQNNFYWGVEYNSVFYIFKYNSDGVQLWEKIFPGYVNSVFVDQASNLYAAGTSIQTNLLHDYIVIKYDSEGNELWERTYDGDLGGDDDAYFVTADSSSNVYVTGMSDWGFLGNNYDFATLKYDNVGNLLWVKRYDGTGHANDSAYKIVVDQYGNVYVGGSSTNAYNQKNLDYTAIKYDSSGNLIWAITYDEPTNTDDYANNGLLVDHQGNVYSAGSSYGINSYWDFALVKYSQQLPMLQSSRPAIDDSSSPTHNGIIETNEQVNLIGNIANNGSFPASSVYGLLTSGDPILINDASAQYPYLMPGTNAQCISCYSIQVPSVNRPATHWDVSVSEHLSCFACNPASFDFSYHVGNSFQDVSPTYLFYPYIETLFHYQIANGCNDSNYCPGNLIQRQQIAKMLCRTMNLSAPNSCISNGCSGLFADVATSSMFCPEIEALYNAGVVSGCQANPLLYCPLNYVQRQALAKLVCSSMEVSNPGSCPLAACSGIFTDVPPGNIFCTYIEALYNAGIVSGCSAGSFCPYNFTTRAQISKILVNGFGLSL